MILDRHTFWQRVKDALIPRRYIAVTPSYERRGQACVMPPEAFDDFRDGEPPEEFNVRSVWMTRRRYRALGEFEGF